MACGNLRRRPSESCSSARAGGPATNTAPIDLPPSQTNDAWTRCASGVQLAGPTELNRVTARKAALEARALPEIWRKKSRRTTEILQIMQTGASRTAYSSRIRGGGMASRRRFMWLWLPLLALALAGAVQAAGYSKPKVRAITAFVRLERAHYAPQIAATLAVLRDVKREFEQRGYEVETLRIVTQPLAELVQGQSDA